MLKTLTISMNYFSSKWNRTSKRKVSFQHTMTHLVSRVKQASMKLTHLFHKVTQIAMRNLYLMLCLHLILLLLVPLWLPDQTWQLLILLFFRFLNMSTSKDSGPGSLAGKVLILEGTSNYHTCLESIQLFLMTLKVWCIVNRTSLYPSIGTD